MRVQNHSVKPPPVFFGKDAYHLGVELEVEAPNHVIRENGLNLSRAPRYCYAKHDGSLLDTGWELVTHPISRKYWMAQNDKKTCVKSFFKLVKGLKELGYKSHVGGRCGLHIHVSYAAFRGVVIPRPSEPDNPRIIRKKLHLYWFMKLINSELYRDLSQRTADALNQWAAIIPVTVPLILGDEVSSRYLATNLTRTTVEVRLFRGNMREDRIRKAIESVVAAVEYSRGFQAKHYKAGFNELSTLQADFILWIEANKKEYPNLYNFLVEIGKIAKPVDHALPDQLEVKI